MAVKKLQALGRLLMLFLLLPIFHHQDRAAGFEWVLINAVTDRGANAGDDEPGLLQSGL